MVYLLNRYISSLSGQKPTEPGSGSKSVRKQQEGNNIMAQNDVNDYLHQIIEKKLEKISENGSSTDSGNKSDPASETAKPQKAQMTETRIYVGLNDLETKEQKFSTEKFQGILKKICRNYHVAFSLDIEEGGYFHEDGTYTEETSLVLIMIEADPNVVQEIAKDLCTFFHQESVLVTEDTITGYFVNRETLD